MNKKDYPSKPLPDYIKPEQKSKIVQKEIQLRLEHIKALLNDSHEIKDGVDLNQQ